MTTVVVSQPMYFPWPGFLAQLSIADVVVWLDDAQFSRGFTNRVQIRSQTGVSWLTVPLIKGGARLKISDIEVSDPNWIDAHVATLQRSLHGAPHKDVSMNCLQPLRKFERVSDALIASSEVLALTCGIKFGQRHLSTDLNITATGSKRILDLVKAVDGTRYITGHGARNYLDHEAFEAEGIGVEYMDYDVKPWGAKEQDFTPFITGLDLLAHVGSAQAIEHLNPKTVPWQEFLERR